MVTVQVSDITTSCMRLRWHARRTILNSAALLVLSFLDGCRVVQPHALALEISECRRSAFRAAIRATATAAAAVPGCSECFSIVINTPG
jgi:hypothetical protein